MLSLKFGYFFHFVMLLFFSPLFGAVNWAFMSKLVYPSISHITLNYKAHSSFPTMLQCDPNLRAYNIFIDNLDERLPRITFFAIRAGEELTFDYKKTSTRVTLS